MVTESTGQTSAQWWQATKTSKDTLDAWLLKQLHGEVTASQRILALILRFDTPPDVAEILVKIANQEFKHAIWVLHLLRQRGVRGDVLTHKERYWSVVEQNVKSLADALAVGSHAENMRLERIRVIAADPDPEVASIRHVFEKILMQEEWHAQMFTDMAGWQALARIAPDQKQAEAVLGLVI